MKVKPVNWVHSEPLRLHVYAVVGGVLGILTLLGLISGADAEHWITLVSLALGTGAGTEIARSTVDSPATVAAKLAHLLHRDD